MVPDRLTQKKTQRFQFLKALYDTTDGDSTQMLDMWQLGEDLTFDSDDTQKVAEYLSGEGLIEFRAIGGVIGITHYGVVQVEKALSKPEEPTQYFPPVVNILHVQSMVGSQIQQGTQSSTITATVTAERMSDVKEFVTRLREALPSLHLEKSVANEAQADASTIDAQLSSPKPKWGIVRESLTSIRHVLEHAGGHALAVELIARLGHLLGS